MDVPVLSRPTALLHLRRAECGHVAAYSQRKKVRTVSILTRGKIWASPSFPPSDPQLEHMNLDPERRKGRLSELWYFKEFRHAPVEVMTQY